MKHAYNIFRKLALSSCLLLGMLITNQTASAQDEAKAAEQPKPAKVKPVKNTFMGTWLLDNQTVYVPVKGTMQMDIQHRFGVINNGYQDFWGLFAPSNIRIGVNYAPINHLFIGVGITKSNMLLDGNAKYAIITQTKGKYPVSVSYYANMAYDTRKDPEKTLFKYATQRLSYFHQLLIARKINDKFSVQVAPSLSHQNGVNGYYTKNDSTGQQIFKNMKFDHFAIALGARYKLTNSMALMINYDQPLTKHNTNNPNPNLSFGIDVNTSSHSFQFFFGNYFYLNPQRNNLYNTNAPFGYNDPTKTHPVRMADDPATASIDESTKVRGGRFVIGFNITRLWNY